MLDHWRARQGQAITAEYVVTVMVVIAAAAAMFLYTKRTFQAKAYDVQRHVMNEASLASGQPVGMEYEPYYVRSMSNTDLYQMESSTAFDQTMNLQRQVESESRQLSPTGQGG
jgi:hypothetical protein